MNWWKRESVNPWPYQGISLYKAVFCENCYHVTDGENNHCVQCGASGESVVRLETLLDRTYINRSVK